MVRTVSFRWVFGGSSQTEAVWRYKTWRCPSATGPDDREEEEMDQESGGSQPVAAIEEHRLMDDICMQNSEYSLAKCQVRLSSRRITFLILLHKVTVNPSATFIAGV